MPSKNLVGEMSGDEPLKKKQRVSVSRVERAVYWPRDVSRLLGVSDATRWRWERKGLLPARDIHIGSRSGWGTESFEGQTNVVAKA